MFGELFHGDEFQHFAVEQLVLLLPGGRDVGPQVETVPVEVPRKVRYLHRSQQLKLLIQPPADLGTPRI